MGHALRHNLWMILWACIIGTTAMGCAAAGPDYRIPEANLPNQWHAEFDKGSKESISNLATWWKHLDDPVLYGFIQRAVQGNLDLKKARARVTEARARRGISESGLYPSLDTIGSAKFSKASDSGGGGTREMYQAGFDAGWEIDVFGGVRRSVEASQADLEASQADLKDVLVTLVSEVALNYVDVRTDQARLAVAEDNLKIQQETFELTHFKWQAGLVNALDVSKARYNLKSTEATLPVIRTSLQSAQNRLAVLLGETPGSLSKAFENVAPVPVAAMDLAIGVPADILRNRPDVRRAERNLAAQTARIGQATADLYPKLSLTGSIGLESLKLGKLLNIHNRSESFGPGISWNIFDAGAIRQNIKVQTALQEQALATYEAAILDALEEVENAITAYAQEHLKFKALKEAMQAAQEAVSLAKDQYASGTSDFQEVLEAERSLLSFQDQMTTSKGTITANLIRLYKALGGGWQVENTEG